MEELSTWIVAVNAVKDTLVLTVNQTLMNVILAYMIALMEAYVKTLVEASLVNAHQYVQEIAMHVAVVHAKGVVLASVILQIALRVCAHLGLLDKPVTILEVSLMLANIC